MFIVADIGNSCAHFGIYDDGKITDKIAIPHAGYSENSDFIACLNKWWNSLLERKYLMAVAMGSVYDPLVSGIYNFFRDKLPVFEVKSSLDVGLEIDYLPLDSLGVDRFANIVAFSNRYSAPGIIIDIGSALTVDIIDVDNKFAGGLIYPGPQLSINALHTHTSNLPLVTLDRLSKYLGKSTRDSILYGISSVYTLYIDALIMQIKRELDVANITAVVTGGWSKLWYTQWLKITSYDADLTLRGIGDIYMLMQ